MGIILGAVFGARCQQYNWQRHRQSGYSVHESTSESQHTGWPQSTDSPHSRPRKHHSHPHHRREEELQEILTSVLPHWQHTRVWLLQVRTCPRCRHGGSAVRLLDCQSRGGFGSTYWHCCFEFHSVHIACVFRWRNQRNKRSHTVYV